MREAARDRPSRRCPPDDVHNPESDLAPIVDIIVTTSDIDHRVG